MYEKEHDIQREDFNSNVETLRKTNEDLFGRSESKLIEWGIRNKPGIREGSLEEWNKGREDDENDHLEEEPQN